MCLIMKTCLSQVMIKLLSCIIAWEKKYSLRKLLSEFPNKGWTPGGLIKLLRKTDPTNSAVRVKGSGRLKL